MNPVISIVLPTYNGARYISRSIESCLEQTFADFELIIVNDCSTDDTAAIIEQWAQKDSRIRVIHNRKNLKLPMSLNAGFEEARGEFHTWTSDDNYYSSGALEFLLSELKKNPGTGFIYSDYTIINENGQVTGLRAFGDINKKFTSFQGCSACFLYDGSLFKKTGGYNPSAFLIEDYEFFVRCFLEAPVMYSNRTDLYYYREHDASLSSQYGSSVNDVAKLMVERLIPKLEAKLPPEQLKLLYRKYAVYYANLKNNSEGYKKYLGKLYRVSKMETLKTIMFVPLLKSWNAIRMGFSGFGKFLGLLAGK